MGNEGLLSINKSIYSKMKSGTLKFEGYFTEAVEFSQLENSRIRHLVIYFYLEDNTISVHEPRQRNSGIMQGTFLKRQRVFGQGEESYITPHDFRINSFLSICGQNIYIARCDKFTRNFYENLGCNQEDDQEINTDNFESIILKSYIPKDFYGLNSYVMNGRVPQHKQFLENDRKVLRFNVTSEKEDFVIHYYLADDTIDVCEIKMVNSGKNPFPLLMKKQKMLKQFKMNLPGIRKEEEYIQYNDFYPGETIILLNRSFNIIGCDAFTKEFYQNNLNREFPLFQNSHKNDKNKCEIIIPPHNGIGTEEDSLQNVLKLIPKPPKKDFKSLMYNTTILKFVGKLMTEEETNANRNFVITFFLADKSIYIYENEIKNNGFMPGKFIEKTRYRNVKGNLIRRW